MPKNLPRGINFVDRRRLPIPKPEVDIKGLQEQVQPIPDTGIGKSESGPAEDIEEEEEESENEDGEEHEQQSSSKQVRSWIVLRVAGTHLNIRYQSMSARMAGFDDEVLRSIQAEILAREYDESVNGPCHSCDNKHGLEMSRSPVHRETHPPRYRCLECFHSRPICASCIKEQHTLNPFHRIQYWTGKHFEKASLHSLGFTLYLGHDGSPCPLNRLRSSTKFVVVHTNGIHDRNIEYCICSPSNHSYDNLLQLVRNRLFPATKDFPRSVFTFEVLEDFHRHSLSSKTSAYDYYNALRMHTNAAFPQDVEVRPSNGVHFSLIEFD